ncbi:OLC1v1004786C1 [Oldenlandia corymbosa var. corymbosa]|uniref:OLC1v1004786C1 n=1 Tax=Oldenlandia corymbosa var. corymbosa TaxID=529605 RepID=A0AAV1DDR7_OLDCO|nr:OLC1v1004786C1 [Oldenlandia corymbosa var. corymbosa]
MSQLLKLQRIRIRLLMIVCISIFLTFFFLPRFWWFLYPSLSLRFQDSQDHQQDFSNLRKDESIQEELADDDWEAVADRSPDELLTPISLPGVSKLSLEDVEVKGTKRRGRGTFSYKKAGMYSDERLSEPVIGDEDDIAEFASSAGENKTKNLIYGTKHILVLSGFPPSTRTLDLEKLLERFKDRGVVIRWVNDTTALAVFKSPSIALDASMSIKCSFSVRILEETDEILSSIPPRDLEPPAVRPKTSARTAQRLIAQSMGIKLDTTSFGSEELRKQEAARKSRIISRQHMKEDAWGDDAS